MSKADIIALHQAGLRQKEIAARLGIHQTTVSSVLIRAGFRTYPKSSAAVEFEQMVQHAAPAEVALQQRLAEAVLALLPPFDPKWSHDDMTMWYEQQRWLMEHLSDFLKV